VEAADNGLLAPELANGITRIKGVKSKGVRLGNWLTVRQAQTLLNTPDISTKKGLRDRAILAVLLLGPDATKQFLKLVDAVEYVTNLGFPDFRCIMQECHQCFLLKTRRRETVSFSRWPPAPERPY
jgi:hypothetical protein